MLYLILPVVYSLHYVGYIFNLVYAHIGHTSTVTCVRFGTDGYTVCSTSMDKTARVWDIRMPSCILKVK